MPGDLSERLIPTPVGFGDEVKRKAARAERAWECRHRAVRFGVRHGSGRLRCRCRGPACRPVPWPGRASSFYFKLRAKWAREDPPRPDFTLATEYRPPRLDLMALVSNGRVPRGAGVPALLHAAGASVAATVLCAERALGASVAAQQTAEESVRAALAERVREAYVHARRAEMLTMSVHTESQTLLELLPDTALQGARSPQAREEWSIRCAGRSFDEVLDKRVVGQLIAAGLDERLLTFALPSEFPSDSDAAVPAAAPPAGAAPAAAPPADYVQRVLAEAGAAAEDFGTALRQWAWEATLDPSLDAAGS